MKIIHADKQELRLRASRQEKTSQAFVFDIDPVLEVKPRPRRVVIETRNGRYWNEYQMSWRKFLNQQCIGSVAIIDLAQFNYSAIRAR